MDMETALKFALDIKADDIRAFARSIMEEYESAKDDTDFFIDTDEGEYRFIHKDAIDAIFRESIEELADECYDIEGMKKKMGNLAVYFSFDYDSFADDAKMDGFGHHFSSYDGSEYEQGKYYMFRTN